MGNPLIGDTFDGQKKAIEPFDGLPADQKRVIEVAIRYFEQYGPQRTTMADIAEAAGVSRKTIYRWFEERAALIEHVLVKMFDESRVDVFSFVTKFEDPREAIIEGAIFSIENSLENKLFNQLVYKDNSYKPIQLLFRTNKHIYQSLLEFWGPIFQNGRQQGQIRKFLSDRGILELLLTCHSTLFLRREYDTHERRRFLYDLLWSAISNPADLSLAYEKN